jgi:hypothetical protein
VAPPQRILNAFDVRVKTQFQAIAAQSKFHFRDWGGQFNPPWAAMAMPPKLSRNRERCDGACYTVWADGALASIGARKRSFAGYRAIKPRTACPLLAPKLSA